MRFFRRGEPEPPTSFWSWWSGARDRVAAAIDAGAFDNRLIEEVSRAVRGVDPQLAWEFQPGRASRHALCVTPEGNAETRPLAMAWLAGAPPPDATWEYYAARQPAPTLGGLEIAGRRLELVATRAITSWNEQRQRLDVRLWNPGFEGAPSGIPEQVAFLFLDNLLGEDDVERWIGQIDVLDAPSGDRTPDELKAEVDRRAAEPAGETWIVGTMTNERGETVFATADAGLKRIDHPYADQHVAIRIVIEGGGMPDDALATQLNAEEDRLVAALAGSAKLAGRTTARGERVLHFVADDMDRVRAGIDGWATGAPAWRVKVESRHDPSWQFQRELGVG